MKLINLTGRIFGRLTVLSRKGTIRNSPGWLCKCSCGKEKTIAGYDLKSGNSRSCGCLQDEIKRKRIIDLTGRIFGDSL